MKTVMDDDEELQDRSISPPPSKRRRRNSEDHSVPSTSETSVTIYSWNINGISPFLQPSITSFLIAGKELTSRESIPKASLRDFLIRHGWPTILFLQEVKIKPGDSQTIAALKKAVRKQGGEPPDAYEYEARLCLPCDRYNAQGFGGKVYGVCSIVRKDFFDQYVQSITTVSWDCEGRIQIVKTKAVGNMPKLAIINIYAVNGTDNPYKDPETGLVAGTRHDRKIEVHKRLQTEIQTLESDGFGVVVAGDLNVARSGIDGHPDLRTFPEQHCLNRADFESRFFSPPKGHAIRQGRPATHHGASGDSGLNMIDTFRYLHPEQKAYTYYPRTKVFGESCDRVDLIMLSESLRKNLVEAGIHETQAERGPSDHVPLYTRLRYELGRDGKIVFSENVNVKKV